MAWKAKLLKVVDSNWQYLALWIKKKMLIFPKTNKRVKISTDLPIFLCACAHFGAKRQFKAVNGKEFGSQHDCAFMSSY